jgi:hypothetical protein
MIELAPDNHIGHECTLVEGIAVMLTVAEYESTSSDYKRKIASGRWACCHDGQAYVANPSITEKPDWATHYLIGIIKKG